MSRSLSLIASLLLLAVCWSSSTSTVIGIQPPVWPLAFNSTLMKIGPDSFPNDITFTKLYFSNASSRFDFYTSYIGLDQQWHCNFTILFTTIEYQGTEYPMIYHIYPDGGPGPLSTSSSSSGSPTPTCYIRANNIPNISRWWLADFSFKSLGSLRGVPTQWWQLAEDDSLNYFNRLDQDQTPVRSTNQANDPGATDYSDFLVGPQLDSLFAVPSYCPPPISEVGVQDVRDEFEWIHQLPQPFQYHVRNMIQEKTKEFVCDRCASGKRCEAHICVIDVTDGVVPSGLANLCSAEDCCPSGLSCQLGTFHVFPKDQYRCSHIPNLGLTLECVNARYVGSTHGRANRP